MYSLTQIHKNYPICGFRSGDLKTSNVFNQAIDPNDYFKLIYIFG